MKIKSDYYSDKGLVLITLTGVLNRHLNSFQFFIGDLDISKEQLEKETQKMVSSSGHMALYKIKENLLRFGTQIYVDANEEEKRILIEMMLNDNI